MSLAASRDVFVTLEQPMNSLFYHVPCVHEAFLQVEARRLCTCLGAFGAPSLKPLELQTTVPEDIAQLLVRSRKEGMQRVAELRAQGAAAPCMKRVGRWTCRTEHMSESQEYPADFCIKIGEVVAALVATA